jgi:uncharacterized repeat protein (TIGR03943 family)
MGAALMRRFAQTVLLFLLGGMLCKLVITGTFLRYVSDGQAPLLAIAGAALLAIAGVNLWRDLQSAGRSGKGDLPTGGLQLDGLFGSERERAARPEPDDPHLGPTPPGEPSAEIDDPLRASRELSDVDHRSRAQAAGRAAAAHEGLDAPPAMAAPDGPELRAMAAPTAVFATVVPRGPEEVAGAGGTGAVAGGRGKEVPAGGTWGGWALLAVALAVLLIAPPALGAFPATRAGTLAAAAAGSDAPPPGDPVPMSLVDYVAHASSGAPALAGRQVQLVGFIMAGPHGEPYIVRLVIGCCAAGARPAKVGLTGDLTGVLTPGGWVEVVGTYVDRTDFDPVNGAAIPYLSVVSLSQIPPPADPYDG